MNLLFCLVSCRQYTHSSVIIPTAPPPALHLAEWKGRFRLPWLFCRTKSVTLGRLPLTCLPAARANHAHSVLLPHCELWSLSLLLPWCPTTATAPGWFLHSPLLLASASLAGLFKSHRYQCPCILPYPLFRGHWGEIATHIARQYCSLLACC